MKKLVLLAVLTLGIFVSSQATAANYHVDEAAVDQLFSDAVETIDMSATISNSGSAVMSDEKEAIIAIVLDVVLPGLGIHRLYLGTEIITWLLYPITFGGLFGVVPLIDLIALVMDMDDISAYVDNPDFFMWKDMF